MKTHHTGRILLREDDIASALGFPGGTIHFIGRAEEHFGVMITIEHPNLPKVEECDEIPRIDIVIHRIIPEYDFLAAGGLIRKFKESIRAFMLIWKFNSKYNKVGEC